MALQTCGNDGKHPKASLHRSVNTERAFEPIKYPPTISFPSRLRQLSVCIQTIQKITYQFPFGETAM